MNRDGGIWDMQVFTGISRVYPDEDSIFRYNTYLCTYHYICMSRGLGFGFRSLEG